LIFTFLKILEAMSETVASFKASDERSSHRAASGGEAITNTYYTITIEFSPANYPS
jgi:hypothetical protein